MKAHIVVCSMLMVLLFTPVLLAEDISPVDYLGGNTSDISAASNAISPSSEDSDYLLYNETFAEFSLLYPKGSAVLVSGDANKTESSFLTPANITILKVTTVPSDVSLDAIVQMNSEKISQLPNFTLITNDNVTLGSTPAKKVEYTWTDKTGSLSRTTQIFSPHNGRIYVITVQFPDTEYELSSPVLEKMIQSFQFIPHPNKPRSWSYSPYGWIWYPDVADLARWNWDYYSGNNYFSSTDYWGTGMDWLDVSNARWDWYMNSD